MLNSSIVAVGAATVAVVLGATAAYGIARFRFFRPQNGSLTTWFLSQRVSAARRLRHALLPHHARAEPDEHGLGPDPGQRDLQLALPGHHPDPDVSRGSAWNSKRPPRSMGHLALSIFLKIAVPLVLPGIVVSWVLCLAFSWNEFLFGFAMTIDQARPVTVFLAGGDQTRGVDFQAIGTRMLFVASVPLIAALAVQRYIVRGLSLGAVKG